MTYDWMRGLLGAIALGVVTAASPGAAQAPAASTTDAPATALTGNQVRIVYGEPKNPAHRLIYERLQKRRVLEDLQEFLSPLRLPQPLTIKMEACNGTVNAYYSNQTVTICYEYIAWIHQIARKMTLTNDISLEDAVVGPFVDVLLHETAHAIFDLLKIPLFGREEDAADQLAAFILLQFGNDAARRTISGAALLFRQMATDRQPGSADYAAVHGLPAQRFINVLCIAYGAQPKLFADFVKQGFLPVQRVGYCRWEYRQILYAFKTLISPHVDPVLQEKVRGRQWLRPDDGR
jgi:Putative metallopeptidase